MPDRARIEVTDSRFLMIILWLCVAGALWLLLSPAAFARRDLTRRTEALQAAVHREALRNAGLDRWRDGLENDPSLVERKAREQGYGRPGERIYPVSPAELRAARQGLRAPRKDDPSLFSTVGQSVAPVLMLLIGGIIAIFFFTDLRVEDPAQAGKAPEKGTGEAP